MGEKQKIKDFLEASGLLEQCSDSLLQKLEAANITLPAMPVIATFLREQLASPLDKPLGKDESVFDHQIEQQAWMEEHYPRLNPLEKYICLSILSPYAHEEGFSGHARDAMDSAYEAYQKDAAEPVPKPRLIIADSDFAFAYGGRSPGSDKGSIIISSYLARHAHPRELNALISYELHHIAHHSDVAILSPLTHRVMDTVTLDATRRRREHTHDAFAIKNTGGDIEGMEALLTRVYEHNGGITQALNQTSQALFSEMRDQKLLPPAILNVMERFSGHAAEPLIHKGSGWLSSRTPLKERVERLRKSVTSPAEGSGQMAR